LRVELSPLACALLSSICQENEKKNICQENEKNKNKNRITIGWGMLARRAQSSCMRTFVFYMPRKKKIELQWAGECLSVEPSPPACATMNCPRAAHHHTYYVTSSYILCHIIIHTMSHHHTCPVLMNCPRAAR
jgi:hypothetical protein